MPWVATRSVELGLPGIQARLPITLPQLESWPQRTRVPWSRERFVSVPTFGVRVTPLEAEPALLALWADKARGGLDVYGSHAAALFAPPEQAAALQRSLAAEIRDFYHMRDRCEGAQRKGLCGDAAANAALRAVPARRAATCAPWWRSWKAARQRWRRCCERHGLRARTMRTSPRSATLWSPSWRGRPSCETRCRAGHCSRCAGRHEAALPEAQAAQN